MCPERPKILETTLRSPKSDFRWLRSYQSKFWVNRRCRWSRVSRQNRVCEALKQNPIGWRVYMTWHPRINPGPQWWRGAGAPGISWRGISWRVLLTGLMAWRMTVQNCWRGWWRCGSTRFSCRNSGEEDAWSACSALVRVGSAVVGACGYAGRRFFAGFSPVDSARRPLHDGMVTKTFWQLWFLGLDQTPSFSRTSSDTSC
jgi:hypothetical protein